MQRLYPAAVRSKSTFSMPGFFGSRKSTDIIPPDAHASWSMRPHGLPKKTFSAYCEIFATVTGSALSSLKKHEIMVPIMSSKAAEDESPEPPSTSEVVTASNPPARNPLSRKPRTIPAIRAAEVPNFEESGPVYSEMSTVSSGKPLLLTLIRLPREGAATAMMSMLTAAARIFPWLWSVWLPESSLRPGTEKRATSRPSP